MFLRSLVALFILFALGQNCAADSFTPLNPALPAPMTEFSDPLGAKTTLANFGKNMLFVNFWATWCLPCVKEMPSLDRLARDMAGEGLSVLAISLDTSGVKKVAPFYRQYRIDHLKIWLDERGRLAKNMKARLLPTSYLINQEGMIVAQFEGSADWDDPDLRAEIMRRLKGTP